MARDLAVRPPRFAGPLTGARLRSWPGVQASTLVYALILVTALSQAAIVPLLPAVGHRYGLRASELAWVLTLPSLAVLVTSTAVGMVGDRFGNRRVTLAAGGLLAVAVAAQGVPSLTVLILGRLAFGVGYGALWTTGLAWLAGLDAGGSARRLGATVTASAVGTTVGPTLAGVLASQFGFAVPFVVAGVLTAGVAVALVAVADADRRRPRGAGETPAPATAPAESGRRPSGAGSTLTALRRPVVLAGALTLALSGGVGALVQLLVPLELHAAGRSSQSIGLFLSAGAMVYIVFSALSVHLGPRITRRRINAATAALLAVALLPAVLGTSTVWVVATLFAAVGPRAVTGTVAYGLATSDAEEGGPGTGTVLGLLNMLWAVATVVAPVAAGALKTAFDARTAWAASLLVAAAVATYLVRGARFEVPATVRGRLRRPSRLGEPVRAAFEEGEADWPAVEVHPPVDRTPTGQILAVQLGPTGSWEPAPAVSEISVPELDREELTVPDLVAPPMAYPDAARPEVLAAPPPVAAAVPEVAAG